MAQSPDLITSRDPMPLRDSSSLSKSKASRDTLRPLRLLPSKVMSMNPVTGGDAVDDLVIWRTPEPPPLLRAIDREELG